MAVLKPKLSRKVLTSAGMHISMKRTTRMEDNFHPAFP